MVQVQAGCLSINSEAVTIFGQFLPKQICSLPRGIRRTTSHLNSSRSLPLSGRSLAPRFESLITRSLHLSKYKRPSHVNHGHQQSDLILSHGLAKRSLMWVTAHGIIAWYFKLLYSFGDPARSRSSQSAPTTAATTSVCENLVGAQVSRVPVLCRRTLTPNFPLYETLACSTSTTTQIPRLWLSCYNVIPAMSC